MPLDPQLRALMEGGATQVPAGTVLSVDEVRPIFEQRARMMAPAASVAKVDNLAIDGPGGKLAMRIYTPYGDGPFPMIVFFHGSGFVVSSLNTHDGMCRNLCAGSGCLVVSVDYRLAPENKFPAAVDDCAFATRWAIANAKKYRADGSRTVVAGDSAGGNLAAVTAMRLRDEAGPRLCGQLLMYPVTDYHTPGTPSYEENAVGYGLTRDGMKWFWGHYLNSEEEASNPYAAPLRARDLGRLPPACIMTAEFDPLRDEGDRYAQRLDDAGVEVSRSRWDGMTHGFMFWVGLVAKADAAMAEACKWLRQTTSGARAV